MANEASVLLNIGAMIDLAIGTPEVGVVDFNMLQTVLHLLAQQMRVLDKNVELRGNVATLPVAREHVQTIAINEYVVDTDDAKSAKTDKPVPPSPQSAEPETILVVERIKKTAESPSARSPPRGQSPGPHSGQSGALAHPSAPRQTATSSAPPSAPPRVTSSERLSLVTLSKFNLLENTVEDLKNRVYGSMPKNDQILEEVRSQTNLKAITDMWTSLNVSSRLEATEEGIAKLSSLVQDLISETSTLQDVLKRRGSKTGTAPSEVPPSAGAFAIRTSGSTIAGTPGADTAAAGAGGPAGGPESGSAGSPGSGSAGGPAGGTVDDPRSGSAGGPGSGPAGGPGSGPAGAPESGLAGGPGSGLAGGPGSGAAGGPGKGPAGGPGSGPGSGPAGGPGSGPAGGPGSGPAGGAAGGPASSSPTGDSREELAAIKRHLDKTRADLDELTNTLYRTMDEIESGFDLGSIAADAAGAPASEGGTHAAGAPPSSSGRRQTTRRSFSMLTSDVLGRISEMEKKLAKCCDSVGKNDGVVQDQINSFQDQLEYLIKQVGTLTLDLSAGKLSPDLVKDLQGLMQLFSTVQEMQEQLQQVHETALQLAAEKEDRQHNINALLEQIELLKTVKMDREDMAEAMAEKADMRMLARKVSHDQFELACDDLSRGLEHALGKLNLQESLWQQALDDIQREIEMKLDKMELSPVKDFFNSKLRQLQENLKQMASLRREAEAAGTKRRLLRDVNCISCDAKAVMPMDPPSSLPASRPMPANFSMKPYLSYELDAIRKSQQTNMPQRNMHDWEAIDKQMGPKQLPKAKSESHKHLCNRYCGGSHTTTTPAQRVARLGHFIKQWGPDVLPLSAGFATGDDGRMYKVSPVEGANVGPGGAVDTTCTPNPQSKQEKPKSPARSLMISGVSKRIDFPGEGSPWPASRSRRPDRWEDN